MPEQHTGAGAQEDQAVPADRGVLATVWNAITAAVGGIMGLVPHVLHHVGLLAARSS